MNKKSKSKQGTRVKKRPQNKPWNSLVRYLSVRRSKTGLGLFTKIPIYKEEFVIEYRGKKISSKKADNHPGKYLFDINSKWTIDGASRSNIARYINHSCRPNCEANIKQGRIAISARKNIKEEEELTYDYGEDYFDTIIKPRGCRCKKCRGKR
jgi:uncharacterized protein